VRNRLWLCSANGHYLGFYAVVLAESEKDARERLHARLQYEGLLKKQSLESIELREVPVRAPGIHVLFNGDS
jgi:hypothetical protein